MSMRMLCPALFAALICGCQAPRIVTFKVEPKIVCPSEFVNVEWEVRTGLPMMLCDGVQIDDIPKLDEPLDMFVQPEGDASFSPESDCTLQLTSYGKGGTDRESVSINVVAPPEDTISIDLKGKCENDGICRFTGSAPTSSSRVLVTRVINDFPQDWDVSHAGRTFVVNATGATTFNFPVPLAGSWQVKELDTPVSESPGFPDLVSTFCRILIDGVVHDQCGSRTIRLGVVCSR